MSEQGKPEKHPSDMQGVSRWGERHHGLRDACARGRDPKTQPARKRKRKEPRKWAP